MGMSDLHGPADEGESIATIHAALDAGFTLLDTGDYYAAGHNQLPIGRALRDRRDKALVSESSVRGPGGSWGQLSAAIEPVAGVIGAALVLASAAFLPYRMAAAAGAMLYVVVEELIPETVRSGAIDVATLGFIVGFAVMMALDNALG